MADLTPTKPHGEMLLDRLLTDPDPLMRQKAAGLLSSVGSADVVAGLKKALHDEEPMVRVTARISLLKLEDKTTMEEVASELRSRDEESATRAARELGAARSVTAVPPLLEAFFHAKDTLAGAIAKSLGVIGDPLAVPLLVRALDLGFVAPSAAEALGAIGDARAIAALIRALAKSRNPALRAAAAHALGGITKTKRDRARAPLQLLAESRVIPALRKAMEDNDRLVRINASVALWNHGDRSRGETEMSSGVEALA
jgi:HEAT repeat protein